MTRVSLPILRTLLCTYKNVCLPMQSPVGPPIGSTLFLVGLHQAKGGLGLQTVLLDDAPEGGVCKPSG